MQEQTSASPPQGSPTNQCVYQMMKEYIFNQSSVPFLELILTAWSTRGLIPNQSLGRDVKLGSKKE
jgi:hypothetical protein